jgi:AcrR family transcriptional regulator
MKLTSSLAPPDRIKLSREKVRADQRTRLIAAMLAAAAERGYRETTVRDVIDRAGVSRPTFYEHFADKEDCFLAAFAIGSERLRQSVDAAVARGGDVWRDRMRFGLEALLHFAATEPETARMLVVEARAASADVVRRRVEVLDDFAACLEAETEAFLSLEQESTRVTALGIVGGVESLLYARLCKGEHDEIETLLPSLMYFLVLPYEGHDAASEELALS